MSQKHTQVIDKLTRNRIFVSRYWKEQCFALNAETILDRAIEIKYIGGLYSGAKRPTKFLCLVFKMLQIGIPKPIIIEYLKAREYKYLTAMSLVYLRLTLKGTEVYEMLQPFYADNRKLVVRNNIGEYSIMYMDELVDKLIRDDTVLGIALPFLPKRLALQQQGILQIRTSLLQEDGGNSEQIPSIQQQ